MMVLYLSLFLFVMQIKNSMEEKKKDGNLPHMNFDDETPLLPFARIEMNYEQPPMYSNLHYQYRDTPNGREAITIAREDHSPRGERTKDVEMQSFPNEKQNPLDGLFMNIEPEFIPMRTSFTYMTWTRPDGQREVMVFKHGSNRMVRTYIENEISLPSSDQMKKETAQQNCDDDTQSQLPTDPMKCNN